MGKSQKTRGLSPKRASFVDRYLVHADGARAAREAGYSPRTAAQIAYQLLQNPSVAAAVSEGQERIAEACRENAGKVLKDLREVADRCRKGIPVLDKDGNPTGEWRFDSAGATRALELIGKHLGMFVERVGSPDGTPLAAGVIYLPRGAGGRQ